MKNFSYVAKSSRIMILYVMIFFIIPVSSYTRRLEDFAINSGTPSESTSLVANRIWIGDIDSKHFSLLEPQQKNQSSITVVTPQVSGSIHNRVPYGSARISHFEFTYSFHVTPGHKFIRLHFHPASYPNFHRSRSLFSVKAGDYTLLKDFNASRGAAQLEEHHDHHKKIVPVEYSHCINVEEGQNILNLTFTPSTTHANSYAFVNGIEVMSLFKHHNCYKANTSAFKLVDGIVHETSSGNSNPDATPPCDDTKNSGKRVPKVFLYGVISAVCAFSSTFVIYCLCLWYRKMVKSKHKAKMEKLYEETTNNSSKSIALASGNSCRHFSIIELSAATYNFDDIFVVGVGGFGKVYQGYIDDGTKPVAIKRFIPELSGQGVQEFKNEVEMLSQLSHPHLVPLIGYCNDEDDMIIVYDFMANGTLRDHLYGSKNAPLSWEKRLEVCIGAGLGLQYLHSGARFKIIHRDVKTSNILLDEEWVAKVSDFGMSKVGPNGVSKFHVSTEVKGSLGYLDPEYSKTKRLTHKSDVYSFGVVLLEVLFGRPPLLRKVEGPERCLVEWAKSCCSHGPNAIDQMVDPFLRGKIMPQCLSKFVVMALDCVVCDGNQRPSMGDVVEGLKLALQLQQQSTQEH